MADFSFEKIPGTSKWMISALGRAKRPDASGDQIATCPFCVGKEEGKEVYRIQKTQAIRQSDLSDVSDAQTFPSAQDWRVRVIPNKYPFAPVHEVVIHSPDHHKNFGELPDDQVALVFQAFRHRYNEHAHKGQVVIFHNRGEAAGESLPHPHTQIVVVPADVQLEILPLGKLTEEYYQTDYMTLFCPQASQWQHEVWIAPKSKGKVFGEATDAELEDMATLLNKLVQAFDKRLGHEFAFNFYVYPKENWYLRFIPRHTVGGFEVATGVFVNTQDPKETFIFLKEHLQRG